jgi:RNA polymerase sigma factor (sigma-70 family)
VIGEPATGGHAGAPDAPRLVEHFFRHEYGRLVALLTRRVGVRHLARVEDAVQGALSTALTAWTSAGLPNDPGAWLYRVAANHLLGDLRLAARRVRLLEQEAAGPEPAHQAPTARFAGEVTDDLLRMLFVCCDEVVPLESRLALALKTLCGFSVGEIALRLFTSEAHVYKRLARARARLRHAHVDLGTPSLDAMAARLPSVHSVLYLLFNEGYLSAHAEQAIRQELCEEAIRLATLLAGHPVGAVPETFALLALMHLHAARLTARQDDVRGLLLLEEQDRSLWDRERLRLGAEWLAKSATGDDFSRFHAEAAIAAEHCFAPSFAETRWREIVELYATLDRGGEASLYTVNRALALAEWRGAQAGLEVLLASDPPSWLADSYLWHAAAGDLYRRAGHGAPARHHTERAIASAPTGAIRSLLRRRSAL